jgi:hypothetical protein
MSSANDGTQCDLKRQTSTSLLIIICFTSLFLFCYGPALFLDRQFGFRDAAHYYYPLHQRVQREWIEGRWPLWEPEENAGMPLLGNPTAAVLYPGKLIYTALPYAWGARVYIMAHTALAFAAMLIMMRSWRISWVGSALAALAYAFGAPVLFQYCNVIYLVGAAWLPLGMRAIDRWVRSGRIWGLLELGVVFAMQVLGGDPQSSYMLGLAGAGYAVGIAWNQPRRSRSRGPKHDSSLRSVHRGRWAIWLVAIGLFAVWFVLTLVLGHWLPKFRPLALSNSNSGAPLPWMAWTPLVMAAAWTVTGLAFLAYWMRRGWRFPLAITCSGLALAAALAMALSAAQLLPVIEFIQQSWRAAAVPQASFQYSLEPFRLVGLIWPNILGARVGEQSYWIDALRLPGISTMEWVPSLYLGGLTAVLATSAMALRRGTPWQIWLTAVVVVSLVSSLGQYSSPIWLTRFVAAAAHSQALAGIVHDLGPLDRPDDAPIRFDGYLRDGDGGVYWWLTAILPGFRQFRYPCKFLIFTSLGLAALAGHGWDAISAGQSRRLSPLLSYLLASSLLLLIAVIWKRHDILALRAAASTSDLGPFDAQAGFWTIAGGLLQASIVFVLSLVAVRLVRVRSRLAGATVLALTTADLAVANSRLVLTIPQALMETQPEVLRIINAAEREKPSHGPYRVHRTPPWTPLGWKPTRAADRTSEYFTLQRDTLFQKHGINLGVEYTSSAGAAELYEYEWFFNGFQWFVPNGEIARALDLDPRRKVYYFPRRSFDIWNTRYFIVPLDRSGWESYPRGYAAFLYQSDVLYPALGNLRGPGAANAGEDRTEERDFQVLRNRHELPRAWIVHAARALPTFRETNWEDSERAFEEIAYSDDVWHEPPLKVFDPRIVAWVGRDKLKELAPFLPGRPPGLTEAVTVTYPSPQRAEIEAKLESAGLVILSDVYYPGWELTIDGKPAPIYRVNRLMRGAAVAAGKHRLVYTYQPRSFTVGRIISSLGVVALAAFSVVCCARPVGRIINSSVE